MVCRRPLTVLSICSLLLAMGSGWVGCAPAYEAPPPAVEGQYLVHVVHTPQETVKELATWYTGSAKNVAAIKAVNPAIGSGALRMGRRVNIPLELVVKTNPPEKVAPTPTPTKLIVIPEQQPPSGAGGIEQGDELANLDDLDKFEEEVGPVAGKDSDSMDLGGVPLANGQAGADNHSKRAPSAAPVEPAPLQEVAPTVRSNVDQFESQVDQLLLKEQAEIDNLQKELSAAQSAPGAAGVKK